MEKLQSQSIADYELLDCGACRRLERFSGVILDRPAPQAIWPKSADVIEWNSADAFYERTGIGRARWSDLSIFPEDWQIRIDDVILELRPSSNNQIGIFPEQLPNWRWMVKRLQQAKHPVNLINAFAYTGATTLMASAAGKNVAVCHVDGARAAVSWARSNAVLSRLENRPIRWIVDDVMKFLKREIRRGMKYDAFILDPPAFGRGPGGLWQLEHDLPGLLKLVNQLLSDTPCFVILSCHATDLTSKKLADILEQLEAFRGRGGEAVDLTIFSTRGNELPSGICGRIEI